MFNHDPVVQRQYVYIIIILYMWYNTGFVLLCIYVSVIPFVEPYVSGFLLFYMY